MSTRRAPAKTRRRRPAAKRARRTYSDIFLDQLKALAGEPPGLVNNRALREALRWDDDRYDRIKEQLVSEGRIFRSRGGPGGAVSLLATGAQALKVFISYSHSDEKLKDALVRHLKPLERMNLIASWSDRKLQAGDAWGDEINRNLEQADLVLLLVSIDFINSKYCYDIELDRALERNARGECRVVPVILRACLWQHTSFARLQALPKDGQPATQWRDIDEALSNVAEGIRVVAEEMIAKK
jgi:hypothetical protein